MKLGSLTLLGVLLLACVDVGGTAQTISTVDALLPALPESPAPTPPTVAGLSAGGQAMAGSARPPQSITLDEAIRRAQTIEHNYLSAWVDRGAADAGRTI